MSDQDGGSSARDGAAGVSASLRQQMRNMPTALAHGWQVKRVPFRLWLLWSGQEPDPASRKP